MKIIILIVVLLIGIPCFAEDPKVYTDQDIGKYKKDLIESTYKYNRAIKIERMAEISRVNMRLLGEDIPIDDLCRKLIENQREMDGLMIGETDVNLISNNTKSKLSLRQLCGR